MSTTRFTVTTRLSEVEEINKFTSKTGVSRNELIRRSTLAYIKKQEGSKKSIEELFQSVGPIDLVEEKLCMTK